MRALLKAQISGGHYRNVSFQIYSIDSEVLSVRLFLIDTFVGVIQVRGGIAGIVGQNHPHQLEIFQLLYRSRAHRNVSYLPHLLLGVLRRRSKRK